MAGVIVVSGSSFEKTSTVLLARIADTSGTPVSPSDLTSISYEVWDIDAEPEPSEIQDEAVDPLSPVTNFVSESLVVDDAWTSAVPGDTEGYNFKLTLPATTFPERSLDEFGTPRLYSVPIKFTKNDGAIFFGVFEIEIREILHGRT